MAKQLPLQEGRKVAFHPPPSPGTVETDENTWILAVVTKSINQDKNRWVNSTPLATRADGLAFRYEVQDAEPQEDGQPGQ